MKVSQRDIVELMYPVGNGQLKKHPAIVISNQEVLNAEGIFFAVMMSTKYFNEDFVFEVKSEMLTKDTKVEHSYIKCQMIDIFEEHEVLRKFGSIRIEPFRALISKLNESVFSIECR